jgi:hypothetical protein
MHLLDRSNSALGCKNRARSEAFGQAGSEIAMAEVGKTGPVPEPRERNVTLPSRPRRTHGSSLLVRERLFLAAWIHDSSKVGRNDPCPAAQARDTNGAAAGDGELSACIHVEVSSSWDRALSPAPALAPRSRFAYLVLTGISAVPADLFLLHWDRHKKVGTQAFW